jgi:hypothetical protein
MVTPNSKSSETDNSPWIPVWLFEPEIDWREARSNEAPSPVEFWLDVEFSAVADVSLFPAVGTKYTTAPVLPFGNANRNRVGSDELDTLVFQLSAPPSSV